MRTPTETVNFKLSLFKDLSRTSWANPRIYDEEKEIRIVEIGEDNNYPIICDNGKQYSLNGKSSEKTRLKIKYNLENPFKDGRLVYGNYTFALRLQNFLENIECGDPVSEDEKETLLCYSEMLLKWQVKTVEKETSEYSYLVSNKAKGI